MVQFTRATKKRGKLRLAFDGPAGSGKTMSALKVARGLAGSGRIAVIDTERGSASLYSDKVEFDVLELDDFGPDKYVEAIHAAEDADYSVVIVDSLSHAWEGKGGALDMKDRESRKPGVNDWTAWRNVTPAHNRLVDAMLQSKAHVIVTMRTKMEYVQEKDEKGKTVIRKVGMAPIQRPGLEYEFTVVGDLDQEHVLTISKTRCDALDRAVIPQPGERMAKVLLDWLESGEEPTSLAPAPATNGAGHPAATPVAGEEVKNGAASPHAAESGTPVLPAGQSGQPQQFAVQIAGARSEVELQVVGAAIAQAVKQGKVSSAQRSELLTVYEKREAQLAGGAAA